MKRNVWRRFPLLVWLWLVFVLPGSPCFAAAQSDTTPTWHAQTLAQAVAYMVIFAVIGLVLAVAGYKLFDKCTPGDLNKEIIENKNVAAAIVAGAVILGVSLIIAAAMLG